jgi:hypothetical protein
VSLTSLTALKEHLGIPSSDSSENTSLTRWIREVSSLVRKYCGSYLGGVVSSYTIANPTVVTSYGHGLRTGDTIVLSDSDAAATSIDGERVITRLTPDTFSVPVNVTVAGTQAYYARKLTEYYGGYGTPELVLRERPVQSITSIYEDGDGNWGRTAGAFASDTLLVDGTDYALDLKNSAVSLSGIVERLNGVWPNVTGRGAGLLGAEPLPGRGNIKVTYIAGYGEPPDDVVLAVHNMIAEVRITGPMGGALTSESYEGYSYTRASASEQAAMLSSAKALLRNYRPLIM